MVQYLNLQYKANPDFLQFLVDYSRLEQAIQQRIGWICEPLCANCQNVCCKIDFCRESLESPFLQQMIDAFAPIGNWDPLKGWLGANGCLLAVGRPPVCYDFVCSALGQQQPSDAHRHALHVLSMLISYVGRNATGKRHLVEVYDLARINLNRLKKQLATAGAILSFLDRFREDPEQNPLPLELVRHVRRS